jgi:hypothetical protein
LGEVVHFQGELIALLDLDFLLDLALGDGQFVLVIVGRRVQRQAGFRSLP